MNLEITEDKISKSYKLSIDGEKVKDAELNFDPYTDQFICEINNEKIAEKIINCDTEKLLIFRKIKLKPLLKFDSKIKLDLEVSFKRKSKKEELRNASINIYLSPDIRSWNNKFTYQDYEELLIPELENLRKLSNIRILETRQLPFEFKQFLAGNGEVEFTLYVNLDSASIANVVSELIVSLSAIDSMIFEKLLLSNSLLNLNVSFKFLPEIKVTCEQYLLYFAKFLQDLGINATSDLKEEAGKVLFSVTPTYDVEALYKIREALAVYLNLPASPISDLEYSENFALMRIQQQVRNLRHSLQMAKTELLSAQYALGLAQQNIENQDQIIVRQHSTIENLNKVVEKITSNSIMTDSLDKKDKEEFEEICEGLRVGESKWLRELTGVGLSTGKFVKTIVKNTFGKEEKNSILGLDEE